MKTNHDSLKDIRDLAFVLKGLCECAFSCDRCPLKDDCPENYPTKERDGASIDEWIAWLKRERVKPNDKP